MSACPSSLRRASLAALLLLGGCTSVEPYDYTLYREHFPRSIVVLPPLDNTLEVEASYAYLSTVTQPLAERGYYVFPVAVVDRMLRDNGLPGPGEMHMVSLAKIDQIFGADAVLYITLEDWGTAYNVLASNTTVTAEARMVDVKTGMELWRGRNTAVLSSNQNNQGGLVGALVGALVNQVVTSAFDPSQDVARQCNAGLFGTSRTGLLYGPYSKDFGKDEL